MKSLFLLVATMFAALTINAQVSRQKSSSEDIYKQGSQTLTEFTLSDSSKSYAFYFQNEEYKTITSLEYISFRSKKDIVDFFTMTIDALDSNDEFTVNVGKQTLFIAKVVGKIYVATESAYFTITRSQAEEIIKIVSQNGK